MPEHSVKRVVLVVSAVVAAALLVSLAARGIASRYHDDSLWANALASLGGVSRPGDFGWVFLPAANDVLEGRSPYMDPDAFVGPPQAPYAYPPFLAVVLAPVALLPEDLGVSFLPGALWSVLLLAAIVWALLLLGVRDWRCYPIVLAYTFTLEAIEYGALGPILLLLLAVLWRVRDRAWGGVALGGAIVLKLFLWPLLLWLLFTQRARSVVVAAAVAAGAALGSWAIIGFAGLDDYAALLRKLTDVEAANSYSALAALQAAGASESVAWLLVVAAGVALLALGYRVSRSSALDREERERRSLTLAVAAALVLTPILWLHYLVLLVLPIALARPRLSGLWLAPLALTVFELSGWYRGWPYGDGRALGSVVALAVIVFAVALHGERPRTPLAAAGRV